LEFSIRIDAVRGVVVVTVQGACTRAGTERMVAAARAATQSHGGLPILYDLREATPGQLAKADIFWMARTSPAHRNGTAALRGATLFPAEFGDTARFWEDSFRNAGLDAHAFEDEQEAVDWLTAA
jgi:hypothetical protein